MGLFKKKNLAVENEEMTWKRDDNAPQFYDNQPTNGNLPTRKSFNYNSYQKVEVEDRYQIPKNNSAIVAPPWASSINEQKEIKSPYVDITPINPEKPYNIRRRITNNLNSSLNQYEETPNRSQFESIREDSYQTPSQYTSNEPTRVTRASSWYRPGQRTDTNPKNREYYELESQITRKMMEEEQNKKIPLKKTDIFNQQKETNNFGYNFYQNQPKSHNVQSQVTNVSEITARRDFEKRKIKIFENQLSVPQVQTQEKDLINTNQHKKSSRTIKANDMDNFEESLESGKSFEELLEDLKRKQRELANLEENYIRIQNDPRNVSMINHEIVERKAKIEKERKLASYYSTEQKVLNDEIRQKNAELSELNNAFDQLIMNPGRVTGEKENTLKEIEMMQAKIAKETEIIDNYAITNEEKKKKWKDLSEKTMNDELAGMKMNVCSFDEDLIRELSYFVQKSKGNRQ